MTLTPKKTAPKKPAPESLTLPSQSLAIVCTNPAFEDQAQALAEQMQLPLLDTPAKHLSEPAQVLVVDETGIALQATGRKAPGPVRVDFTAGGANHRRKFGGGKGQMIAKAVGRKGKFAPHVLDATAGLGGDAFVLACLGCRMSLHERSPVVHQLLADGLARGRAWAALNDPELADILARMQLQKTDSLQQLIALAETDDKPDVVYLDPMFPERAKSASVKKEMVAFHSLVGKDPDADGLLALALAAAKYRVVVKRPVKAQFLADAQPNYQLQGKSSRFDIYTIKKMPE
jgi:16S rRNA (guanine1516-N2)-methyltransferase